MRPQRLRTKLRRIREQAEEMAEEGGELNLIPYLDIVTNVIMFMLATATFAAALGDINVSSPTVSATAGIIPPQAPKNDLNLTVSISDKGFIIAASGAVLYEGFSFDPTGALVQPPTAKLPTVPKKGNDFDFETLARKMKEIKASPSAAGETKVIINANPNILYETVVQVLDATRGGLVGNTYEGFPDVVLSAGVN